MILEQKGLLALVKSYLPQADNDTLDRIATEVKNDAEAIVHSMIRSAVAQEKQHLYLRQKTSG